MAVEHVPLKPYCLGCGSAVRVGDTAGFARPECGSGTWWASRVQPVTLVSVEIEL